MSKQSDNFRTVMKVILARLRFIAVFVVAGLIVGYWETITNYYDKLRRPDAAELAHDHAGDTEFYCTMHPNVIRAQPADCPICGMPLVQRKRGEKQVLPADVLARVQLTPQRVSLANVQTTPVEYKALHRSIRAVGVLDYDETRLAQLSTRVAGRIEQLFVRSVGQTIEKGESVYSLYSPEVFTAQREYLLARQRANQMAKDTTTSEHDDASAVYNASMQKLLLWGLSQEQLDKLDEEFDRTGKVPTTFTVTSPISGVVIRKDVVEGKYLNTGDTPYQVADLTSLWLLAKIYEQDVPLIRIGQPVDIHVDALPSETFNGTVQFLAYQLDPQTRTVDARIVVKNEGLRLRPGMFAMAGIDVPIVEGPASTQPTTAPVAKPQGADAKVLVEALQPYLKMQELMAADKSDGLAALAHATVQKLDALKASHPDAVARVERSHGAFRNDDISASREAFKEFSGGMIELGRTVGLPPGAQPISVYRCPMAKANWLQPPTETINPYMGAKMLECGGPVQPLPIASTASTQATKPARAPAGRVLAVPRSAVIDTGAKKIMYVQSAEGVFDMREVKIGPLAEDWYPVLSGVAENELVVTSGAFLIDSENRLNPAR